MLVINVFRNCFQNAEVRDNLRAYKTTIIAAVCMRRILLRGKNKNSKCFKTKCPEGYQDSRRMKEGAI